MPLATNPEPLLALHLQKKTHAVPVEFKPYVQDGSCIYTRLAQKPCDEIILCQDALMPFDNYLRILTGKKCTISCTSPRDNHLTSLREVSGIFDGVRKSALVILNENKEDRTVLAVMQREFLLPVDLIPNVIFIDDVGPFDVHFPGRSNRISQTTCLRICFTAAVVYTRDSAGEIVCESDDFYSLFLFGNDRKESIEQALKETLENIGGRQLISERLDQ